MRIKKVDNFNRIAIPKYILDRLGIKAGDQVVITEEDNKIIISKLEE